MLAMVNTYDPDYVALCARSLAEFESVAPGQLPILEEGRNVKGAARREIIRKASNGPFSVPQGRRARAQVVDACNSYKRSMHAVADHGMLMGFMLGVLFRSSPGAVVGYFVYALVLPGVSSALASAQDWWADNGAWFDLRTACSPLLNGGVTGGDWARLGVATLLWLIVPLLLGLRMLSHAEPN